MILVLMGAPGAGKGTQSEFLKERFGFSGISTGDALRRHIREGTEIGLSAKKEVEGGNLVSDELLVGILKSELELLGDSRTVLLDGFPRTVAQAKALNNLVGADDVKAVFIDVSFDVLVDRLSGRRICVKCDSTFHLQTKVPVKYGICDNCGGPLSVRADDEERKVKVRLDVFGKLSLIHI